MRHPALPPGYVTHIQGDVMQIDSKEGAMQMAIDLRWLANAMVNGGIGTLRERAAAGAAILHLLDKTKAVAA